MHVLITAHRPGERDGVRRVARGGRVDRINAVVTIRRAEASGGRNPRGAERGQRRGIARRAAIRAALDLHASLDGAVELAEARRRARPRHVHTESAVDREVERRPGGIQVGFGLIELGRDPRIDGVLTDDCIHGIHVVSHVDHGSDHTTGLDDVQHVEGDERLQHTQRPMFLGVGEGRRGINDPDRRIGVAVIPVAPGPLRTGVE